MSTDEFDLTFADGFTTPGRRRNKLDGTTAPVAGDDSADGYEVGSVWIDVTNDVAYTCVDSTAAAAVWLRIGDSVDIEDTFTPAVTFATPGDLSVVYNTQSGQYTRFGRLIEFNILLDVSTFTHTTASGAFRITGLPAAPVNGFVAPMLRKNFPAGSALTSFTAFGPSAQTYIEVYANQASSSWVLTDASLVTSGELFTFRITGTYHV